MLARTILAVSLRQGARDINTGMKLDVKNIGTREYHHIFPKKYLKDNAPRSDPNKALNCVLIDGKTNKRAGTKPPIQYFRELYKTEYGVSVDPKVIRTGLRSHLVPEIDIRQSITISKMYRDFCDTRAGHISKHLSSLVNGGEP